MTDYTDIITRLEAATGADQELDARVMQALFVPTGLVRQSPYNYKWCVYENPNGKERLWSPSGRLHRPDGWPVTASLDASLALVGEKLPGWAGFLVVLGTASKRGATLMSPVKELGEDEYGSRVELYDEAYGEAPTPSLAVLLALFKALSHE